MTSSTFQLFIGLFFLSFFANNRFELLPTCSILAPTWYANRIIRANLQIDILAKLHKSIVSYNCRIYNTTMAFMITLSNLWYLTIVRLCVSLSHLWLMILLLGLWLYYRTYDELLLGMIPLLVFCYYCWVLMIQTLKPIALYSQYMTCPT